MVEAILTAETKFGEMLAERPDNKVRSSQGGTSKPLPENVTKKESHFAQTTAKNPEVEMNEKQVFPAMRYFVEEMNLTVNAAAKEVSNMTAGLVTQNRARHVWKIRTPALAKRPTQKQKQPDIEQKQEVVTEPYSVEKAAHVGKNSPYGESKKRLLRARVKGFLFCYPLRT